MDLNTRDCGTCVACCVAPEIPGTGSAWKQPCPKLEGPEVSASACAGEKNCTIYADRPNECVEYNCAWIEGYGLEEDRPDRCGVLIDKRFDVQGAPTAKALWRNAGFASKGVAALKRFSKEFNSPILVARYDDFKIVRCVGSGYREDD
jgi:Fe-S-cluster containining protein